MPIFSIPESDSGVWCQSLTEPGKIVYGIEAWKQRCYVVLNTALGSDPLRPLFGCDYRKYIDGSVITSPAKIKKEIIDALTIWVPEVKLGKITYKIGPGYVYFTIAMTIYDESISLPFRAGAGYFFGEIKGTNIINTGYKWYETNLEPSLTLDGVAATPAVPGTLPWTDIPGMMAWIRENWAHAGTWGYSKDEVILYLNPIYKHAVLTLTPA